MENNNFQLTLVLYSVGNLSSFINFFSLSLNLLSCSAFTPWKKKIGKKKNGIQLKSSKPCIFDFLLVSFFVFGQKGEKEMKLYWGADGMQKIKNFQLLLHQSRIIVLLERNYHHPLLVKFVFCYTQTLLCSKGFCQKFLLSLKQFDGEE